jgi:uncharacterized protein
MSQPRALVVQYHRDCYRANRRHRCTEAPETSFDALRARIATALAFLESVPPDAIDEKADVEFALNLPRGDVQWTGLQYLFGFAVPNYYFHMTTAYDILRHNGVPLGKRDFIPDPAAQ